MGEFQRRGNRDRDIRGRGRNQGSNNQERQPIDSTPRTGRGWDSTPRSERDAPSVRVPNVGWDSTPRGSDRGDGGWGAAGHKRWDAPTPRGVAEDGAFGFDSREWEDEQVRLDRDWYAGAEDGAAMGDEEHNPLAGYEDLSAAKEKEIATKVVVSRKNNHACFITLTIRSSAKFLRGKRNT